MKDRIIEYLSDFAQGRSQELAREIREVLALDEVAFSQRCNEVLSGILHQYSQFSISTIDAFFQKVIRSFTRESGLLGNFRLEVENELVLTEVIARLMDELGENEDLTDWVIQFSQERLQDGENWNITEALKGFSKEIFKDSFHEIGEEIERVQQRISFSDFLVLLRAEKDTFLDVMQASGQLGLDILAANSLSVEDFSNKDRGTAYKYFREFAHRRYCDITKTIEKSAESKDGWAAKKSYRYRELSQLAEQQLMPLLRTMIDYYKTNYRKYNSLDQVDKNFYSYGLITDIVRKLREYKAENNLMLLSDASHFLNGIISTSDTPFIYEKVGSFYRHYLIDEFQDTSELQWKNFRPLVQDGLDQNNKSIVVGDVKQSIYRWRGSDLGLLQQIAEEGGADRITLHTLNENWRSAENLVNFNNHLFNAAAARVSEVTGQSMPAETFEDARQRPVRHLGKGYVQIRFLERWRGSEEEDGEVQALHRVPGILEDLQQSGIELQDIAILVRRNDEGQRIAQHLLQYKRSAQAKPGMKYDVVSNESLRLDASSVVLLLLSAMKHLNNPDDAVARGELAYEYARRNDSVTPPELEKHFAAAGQREGWKLISGEFSDRTQTLLRLSLIELTEMLIRIFRLNEENTEMAYLRSFQDLVLEFSAMEKNDLSSFLVWWEEMRDKRSIQVAADTCAVSIYTIHKAKGLQFKFVIIPFCSWSMGHDMKPPLIWCQSDEAPLNQLGYVAVRFKSALENSFFADDYHKEFTKTYLDNLNLLYVAFTRAEEGMIVIAPKPTSGKSGEIKISNVGHLVYDSISQSADLQPYLNESIDTFSMGQPTVLSSRSHDGDLGQVTLEQYPATDWRKKLVVRREGGEFFHDEITSQRRQINYGILMHKALSRIQHKTNVADVLKALNLEGIIGEEEASLLSEKITEMMGHPIIGSWFDKEWIVHTEDAVIVPGGGQSRIDRVISKVVVKKGQVQNKAIIIDYKTGEKKSADRKQVEEYALLLQQMGYVDVEAFLLYLDKLEVVRVVDKMNLNLF